MNSFVRIDPPPGRLLAAIRNFSGVAAVVVAILGLSARPALSATINVDLSTLSAVGIMSPDDWSPTILDDGFNPKTLSYLLPADWAEFPFTVPAGQGGLYSISGKYGTPNPIAGDLGLPVAILLDVRKAGTEAHVASEDLVLTPTGTDDGAYVPSAPFSADGFDLAPGDYVLRIRNISMHHTLAADRSAGNEWRPELSAAANRRVDISDVALTSTGALPATGTISGKVTASDLGYGVGFAYVLAVPSGKEIPEPGPFWYSGHWTMTDANGNYTLSVPAGVSYTVQAGRPGAYVLTGVRQENVTVAAGATQTVDLALKSKWTAVDGSGSIQVEEEYFFDKIPDPLPDLTLNSPIRSSTNVNIATDGNAQNQIKLSWTGTGDYVDVYVDVPTGQAGPYEISINYMSYPGAIVSFIANPGDIDQSSVQADLPNSGLDPDDPSKGYWMANTVTPPDVLQLKEGRNIIREQVESGGADFDAFILHKHVVIPTGPGIANPKDAAFDWIIGEQGSGVVGYPIKNGNTVENLTRGSYVEIPMTFDTPGIYKAVVRTSTPVAGSAAVPPTAASIQLDIRPEGSNAHYSTDDVSIPVGDSIAETTVNDIPVLTAGNYIFRFKNTTQFHFTPETRGDFNAYGGSGFISNRVDLGQTVFTKTASLPATATISGQVKGTDTGVGVGNAEVMANPTGAGVPEPSIIWQKGFWTMTDEAGAYTLPVLAGTYDVQAGQASMYAYGGALAQATVASGATATANVNLPSRITQDASGHYEINVETEYFIGKPVDLYGAGYASRIVAFQQEADASNQIQVGYIDGGDFVDIPIDVPAGAAGAYTLTDYYFNGYWNGVDRPDGIVSFTANPDTVDASRIEDTQPNTAPAGANPSEGYGTPGTKVFGQQITLKAGYNLIRLKLESGSSNFDAFKLTSNAAFPLRPSALRALKIAAGFEPAPATASADFTALDADSSGKITLDDVAVLAKRGQL